VAVRRKDSAGSMAVRPRRFPFCGVPDFREVPRQILLLDPTLVFFPEGTTERSCRLTRVGLESLNSSLTLETASSGGAKAPLAERLADERISSKGHKQGPRRPTPFPVHRSFYFLKKKKKRGQKSHVQSSFLSPPQP